MKDYDESISSSNPESLLSVVNPVGDKEAERETLAQSENRAVQWLRIAVLLLLLIATSLVSVNVFLFTKNDQEDDFHQEFEAHAGKILEAFHDSVGRKLEAIDALSIAYTSHARATGAVFPNVTLPNFEIRGANARILSDAVVIHYYPLVTDETRKGWEAYQIEHRDYFDASATAESENRAKQDARFADKGHHRFLQEVLRDEIENMNMDGPAFVAPQGSGPYLPIWQITPFVPLKSVLNFNVLSHPAVGGAYMRTLDTNKAVMEKIAFLTDESWNYTLSVSQYRHSIDKYIGDPGSALSYPVFDSFDSENRRVVGVLVTTLFWSFQFTNVLPPNARGIICVIKNNHNQAITFRVDGSDAQFIGQSDLHDTKYDSMVLEADISTYLAKKASPVTRSYTSADWDSDYSRYTLHVYPSQDTEDQFVNNDPVIFTIVVIGVFLFTSVVFVAYDRWVARRQRIVMSRAVASGAIVSSLFPSQVRDKLYQENEDKRKNKSKQQNDWQVLEFISRSGCDISQNRPIADFFESTTIMFGDLVGFTEWSSKRTPEQVFNLLETLYNAFDSIAVRRKVFKVETIGDCYVACTGCPEPQEDHAIRMCKFARDCMHRMRQLTRKLADTLGPDTAELEMRVGLHSGSVTAGVLRGAKGRFQLFGDTVNMAARMESNGEKGKIHVSQAMADELVRRGKELWVSAREGTIVAKGKGEVQTYWVNVDAHVRDESTSCSAVSSSNQSSAHDDDTMALGYGTSTEQQSVFQENLYFL